MRGIGAALLAACVLAAPGAWAHAFLNVAAPQVGSTVQTAPREVVLAYSEAVEPAFSSIVVHDQNGHRVDTGGVHLAGDARHLAVGIAMIGPGRYSVHWRVISVDTHRTQGDFSFTVAP